MIFATCSAILGGVAVWFADPTISSARGENTRHCHAGQPGTLTDRTLGWWPVPDRQPVCLLLVTWHISNQHKITTNPACLTSAIQHPALTLLSKNIQETLNQVKICKSITCKWGSVQCFTVQYFLNSSAPKKRSPKEIVHILSFIFSIR